MRWRFVSEAATKQRSQLVGIDSGGPGWTTCVEPAFKRANRCSYRWSDSNAALDWLSHSSGVCSRYTRMMHACPDCGKGKRTNSYTGNCATGPASIQQSSCNLQLCDADITGTSSDNCDTVKFTSQSHVTSTGRRCSGGHSGTHRPKWLYSEASVYTGRLDV